jgi:hypothetical protein
MKNKKKLKLNTFCVMPWISLRNYIGSYYTVCCFSDLMVKENNNQNNDAEKFWNSKKLIKLRKDMLNGVKNSHCDACWINEKNKVKSNRQYFNETFFYIINDFLKKTDKKGFLNKKPFIFDISVGSACDFSCRMCAVPNKKNGKFFDSNKENQEKILKKANVVNKKHFKENIFPFLNKVRYINIAGGEPFIIRNTEYFLEECVKRGFSKNISLKIVTNFNRSPIKFLKLFSKFRRCQLDISIDGIDDLYEYIRYPGKWNKIEKNLVELKKCSGNTFICFAITVQIYNIFNIEEILKFTNKLEKIIDKKIFLYLSCLYRPDFFSVKNLPDDLKNEAVSVIKKASFQIKDEELLNGLNNLIKFIKSNTEKEIKKDFIDYTYFYDKTRKQSYKKFLDKRIIEWIENSR